MMKYTVFLKYLSFTFLFVALFFNASAQKYVFLFIGDGMGEASVNLYESYLADSKKELGYCDCIFNQIPLISMCGTQCKNRQITDSGAAGSAIACGQKFDVAQISYAEGSKPKSIAKYAKEQGMKVGIITTTPLNHATPAAFYANQITRNDYYEIGLQLVDSDFDFFGGGGFIHQTGRDKDEKDLMAIYQESGYITLNSLKAIESFSNHEPKVIFTNPTLERDASMPFAIDYEEGKGVQLSDIVETGINYIDNPNGFFMMVEGGKIDYAAHDNDAATLVREIEEFEKAIKKAYDFYLSHKDETLIIITADHETGGVSLGYRPNGYESHFGVLKMQKMSQSKFSQFLKKQSKSDDVMSVKEYTNLANKFFYSTHLEFADYQYEILRNAYNAMTEKSNKKRREAKSQYDGYNPMAVAYCRIMNAEASVGFSTSSHTCAKVPVFAVGVTTPITDNTGFYNVIKEFIDKK